MRFNVTGIAFILLIICICTYAWIHNPAGCVKLGHDFIAVFTTTTADQPASAPATTTLSASTTGEPAPAAVTTPEPAPAPIVPANPAPAVVQQWTPPNPLPAQANWTWTTSDGKSYQNVVITSINPEVVSISHSMGVAHVPIMQLPDDLQKQLNYDPAAAIAWRAEADRETAHPYYPFASRTDALAVAKRLHWTVAWVDSLPANLASTNPTLNSDADLTQMALTHLEANPIIIIFLNGDNELSGWPPPVHDQLETDDDGALPGGGHFYSPKIVFTNADASKVFGRVSNTQMKANRESAIDSVLPTIPSDSAAQPMANDPTSPAPTTSTPAQ
jgi:hypothetical protein